MRRKRPPVSSHSPSEEHPTQEPREPDQRRFREPSVAYASSTSRFEPFSFSLDADLSARLRRAAWARRWSPEALAARLLRRGLDQEAERARGRATLAMLTPREMQVARLTGRGQTNYQIAYALAISPETVKSHVRSALAKFGLRSKAELRLLLRELGDLDEDK